MDTSRFSDFGDGALAPDHLSQLSSDFESLALDLIASGYNVDAVSGALTSVAVRILCASDGIAATTEHLTDLANRLRDNADG